MGALQSPVPGLEQEVKSQSVGPWDCRADMEAGRQDSGLLQEA